MLLSAQNTNWKWKSLQTLLEANCILCIGKCNLGAISVLLHRCKMDPLFQNISMLQQSVVLQLHCRCYSLHKPFLSKLSLNEKVLIKCNQYKIIKWFQGTYQCPSLSAGSLVCWLTRLKFFLSKPYGGIKGVLNRQWEVTALFSCFGLWAKKL